MTEPIEREQYRMRCKHYGVEGNCHLRSVDISGYGPIWDTTMKIHAQALCLPTSDCPRMKRYDKLHKE